MAKSANATLLAEIERLRTTVGKLTSELGRVKSRLAVVEGSLSQGADSRAAAVREPGKRLH